MRNDVGIPDCFQHKTRGMLTIYEHYEPTKGGMDPFFFEQMAKQLTPAMAETLHWDKNVLKRRLDLSLRNRYIIHFSEVLYMILFLEYSGPSSILWVRCSVADSRKELNLYDLQGVSLQFEIVYYLPEQVKKAWVKIMQGTEETFHDFMKREIHDEWIDDLHDMYEGYKVTGLRFETEISCGWPDCEIRLYMKEEWTAQTRQVLEELFSTFFATWEREHAEEYLHEITSRSYRDKRVLCVQLDFGSIDPSAIEALLNMLNTCPLELKKVVFL